MASTNRYGLLS